MTAIIEFALIQNLIIIKKQPIDLGGPVAKQESKQESINFVLHFLDLVESQNVLQLSKYFEKFTFLLLLLNSLYLLVPL